VPAHEAERDTSIAVALDGAARLRREHSKHTSAAPSPVAVAGSVEAVVGHVGSDSPASLQEMCCVAEPRPHLPGASSRSCACSVGGLGSLPQRSRDLRRSSCDVNSPMLEELPEG
jgi:hypothetical protein